MKKYVVRYADGYKNVYFKICAKGAPYFLFLHYYFLFIGAKRRLCVPYPVPLLGAFGVVKAV